jgi:hypothetical protein
MQRAIRVKKEAPIFTDLHYLVILINGPIRITSKIRIMKHKTADYADKHGLRESKLVMISGD